MKQVDIIIKTIEDKRMKQSILLDGEWGSGKTHFIKNELMPELEKNCSRKKVIYLSAYGKGSLEEIESALYKEIIKSYLSEEHLKQFDNNILLSSVTETGISVAAQYVPKDIKKFFKKLAEKNKKMLDYQNIIFIIDDVERCNIDINLLFGFLNNLVEHKGLNLILSCNEKEIYLMQLYRNFEKISNVSITEFDHSVIDPAKVTYSDLFEDKQEKSSDGKTLTSQDIMRNAVHIFDKISPYKKIKEKLIGLTINLEVEVSEIYNVLVDEFCESDACKKFLLGNKKDILSEFNHEKNLRTIQFYMCVFEEFFKIINNYNKFNREERLVAEKLNLKMAKSIANLVSQYKKGEFDKLITEFKGVVEFITKREYDEEEFKVDFFEKLQIELDISRKNCLKRLEEWYYIDNDEEVYILINELLNLIRNNEFKIGYMVRILYSLIKLKEIGFNVNIDEVVEECALKVIHIESIDIEKTSENFRRQIIMMDDGEEFQEQYKMYSNNFIAQIATNICSLYNNNDLIIWGKDNVSISDETRNFCKKEESFLGLCDINSIVNKISEEQNLKLLISFQHLLQLFYSDSYDSMKYLKKDKQNIELLIEKLKRIKFDDGIKLVFSYRIKWITEILSNYIMR